MRFDTTTVQSRCDTPLGTMLLSASDRGLNGAWFDGQRHQPDLRHWPQALHHPVLRTAQEQLQAYFAGRLQRFDLPLDLSGGTDFQRAVWQELLGIATGRTSSYGLLAQRIGKPAAVRAVGAAVGRNPVSVIVPCHRVLGSDGSLTGYAGGLPRKTALLGLEREALGVAA